MCFAIRGKHKACLSIRHPSYQARGLTCTDRHDTLQDARYKDELAIAPPSYRETAHGKGKHIAGLQAGTPGEEAITKKEVIHGEGRHRGFQQAGTLSDESP